MDNPVFLPAEILLPGAQQDLGRWAVVACDQYTSEPAYWQEAAAVVGDAPSTLHIILPEAFLEGEDIPGRIEQTHQNMQEYIKTVLTHKLKGFVYVERELEGGVVRQGLVGCVDLEDYSYEKDAPARIKPSENTVLERIPSRLAMRSGAVLECPHILMLTDDPNQTVIEPIGAKKDNLPLLYEQELMLGGGHIRGWAVQEKTDIIAVQNALAALGRAENFAARYGTPPGQPPFTLVVGDGNHSLAAAKAYWEQEKAGLSAQEQNTHPARFCLVELENIQSPAITIEPIHRVIFDTDPACLLRSAALYATAMGAQLAPIGEQHFIAMAPGDTIELSVKNSPFPLEAGSLEGLLESYAIDHPDMRVDYVHGEKSVEALVAQGAIGILLPALQKSDLFRGVALGGVLPKKSFSMGHANQKRYYLECRKIMK